MHSDEKDDDDDDDDVLIASGEEIDDHSNGVMDKYFALIPTRLIYNCLPVSDDDDDDDAVLDDDEQVWSMIDDSGIKDHDMPSIEHFACTRCIVHMIGIVSLGTATVDATTVDDSAAPSRTGGTLAALKAVVE